MTRAVVFKSICFARKSARSFSPEPLAAGVIRDILDTTLSSPSSFNLQPYRMVLLQDASLKRLVADQAMLGGNGKKIVDAPLTVVFLAVRGCCQTFFY